MLSPKNFIFKICQPRSCNEDERRKEIILNSLLIISIVGFTILNAIRIYDITTQPSDRGLPILYTLSLLIFFSGLFVMSRRGKIRMASGLLIAAYSLPMFYSFITWGADLPAALLLAALIITMSGILIGPKTVIYSTVTISLFLIILTHLQSTDTFVPIGYWRQENHEMGDAITYGILMLVIASITQFFSLEIEKSLKRARISEKNLLIEKDQLEIRIAERTRQLKEANADKLNQLYRLATFGRLSSGIFHDLVNPLTAISINLEQIKDNAPDKISSAKQYLYQATLAAKKMEGLISGVKKQIIKSTPPDKKFSANDEIEDIKEIMSYKARQAGVSIQLECRDCIYIHGCPVKFGQIIMNLISNAIDACDLNKNQRKILITLYKDEPGAIIKIKDNGVGIAENLLDKIFEPFFSTKDNDLPCKTDYNLGLGLSSVLDIVKRDFNGEIKVDSSLGQGTEFTIIVPRDIKKDAMASAL